MKPNQTPSIKNLDLEQTLFIKGTSMHPFLRTGDLLVIEKTNPCNLKIGDIIVISDQGKKFVVHRLLKIEDRKGIVHLTTKGDNNLKFDMTVSQNEFVGRGNFILRGETLIFLKSKTQRVLAPLLALFSKLNLNIQALKSNFLSRWIKRRKLISSLISLFLPKRVNCTKFTLPDGRKVLKAFVGRFCMANSFIDESTSENLILSEWTVKYPFYNTGHGDKFIISLIRYTKDSGKSFLTFKKLNLQNPVFNILKRLKIDEYVNISDSSDSTIDIQKIPKKFFLHDQ